VLPTIGEVFGQAIAQAVRDQARAGNADIPDRELEQNLKAAA
jgi:hypothetical protein